MLKKILTASITSLGLIACGSSENAPSSESTLSLPGAGETMTVSGKMTFWMYEGDGGCFGTLESEGQDIQLWADVGTCNERKFEENSPAIVSITYSDTNQYGPGKTYTISGFK